MVVLAVATALLVSDVLVAGATATVEASTRAERPCVVAVLASDGVAASMALSANSVVSRELAFALAAAGVTPAPFDAALALRPAAEGLWAAVCDDVVLCASLADDAEVPDPSSASAVGAAANAIPIPAAAVPTCSQRTTGRVRRRLRPGAVRRDGEVLTAKTIPPC
ncbi:hypothetical protein OG976_12955 [Mycobacterium sp. NBC_00419]|uniref:hypothetical protein n=1 Tax=Mycobacterium sp. NBC_00419 TaxID=2975989 RepID=UPI002E1DB796